MAKKEKIASEVGIIGQMYENRKTKKVGVLESREEKFKTLMMRDKDGKSFNVTYSTFRSEWRKYQGEEVVQTSSQKADEAKVEEDTLKSAKAEMSKSTETTVKFNRQERIDAINAMRVVLKDTIKDAKYPLETVHLSKGGTVVKVKGKRRTMFEIWLPLRYPDVYSFRLREDLDNYVELDEEREYIEKDVNCIRYRPKREKFTDVLSVMIEAVEKFVEDTDFLKQKTDETENADETNEEEE